MNRILIIEDDAEIADIERDYLIASGFNPTIASNGYDGLSAGLSEEYDLILLDVMLPGIDGFELCRRFREKLDIPILMVTAKLDDVDKIRGLGLGADDYIEKPFSPGEMVARVKANLAQYARLKSTDNTHTELLENGSISVNTATHRIFVDGKEVELKNKEYELLVFLMRNPDKVFSKDVLYEQIWNLDSVGDNATVAVHINRLREKIEKNPSMPVYIQTVWGAGYRFRDTEVNTTPDKQNKVDF